MANTKSGTSLLAQTNEKKQKWGGDIYNYDINSAVKGYDSALAEYNAEGTTAERKNAINSIYGGDITKWDNKNAYTSYMDDLNEVKYIDSLNNAYTASMDAAKDAEQRKMQYVDTRRALMQKYMPDTLQAQGVANTGYVADSLLKAENNYNQYALGAMSDRAQTEQSAMQAYQDSLQTYRQQQSQNAYERFMQEQAKAEADEKEATAKAEALDREQKTARANFMSMIDEGADINSVIKQAEVIGLSEEAINDLKSYEADTKSRAQGELYNTFVESKGNWTLEQLEAEKPYLSEEQYNDLKDNYLPPDTTKNSSVNVGAWATNYDGKTKVGRDLMSDAKENDVFTVEANGNEYKLKTGNTVDWNSDIARYARDFSNGRVFMYAGKLYVKNGNNVQAIKEGARGYDKILEFFKS